MRKVPRPAAVASLLLLLSSISMPRPASAGAAFTRREDVLYGRKDGLALTMDVLTPAKNPNGAAVVWAVSGGFFSSHDAIRPGFMAELLKRGYTVFAVVHGSQPRYAIPDAVADWFDRYLKPTTVTSARRLP